MHVEDLVATPEPEIVRKVGEQLVPDTATPTERRVAHGIATIASVLPHPPASLRDAVSAGRRSLDGHTPELPRLPAAAAVALRPTPSARSALETALSRMKCIAGEGSAVGKLVAGAEKHIEKIDDLPKDKQAEVYLEALGSIVPILNVVERSHSAGPSRTVPVAAPTPSPVKPVVQRRESFHRKAELLGLLTKCRSGLGIESVERVWKTQPTAHSVSRTSMFTVKVGKSTEQALAEWVADGTELLIKAGASNEFKSIAAGFPVEIVAYGIVAKLVENKISPHFFRRFGQWTCRVPASGPIPAALRSVAHEESAHYPDVVRKDGYGFRFLAMELGHGNDLSKSVTFVDSLPPEGKAAIAFGTLWTVGEMHEAKLQHNDLHPGNIFLDSSPGEVTYTYVLDAEHAYRFKIPKGAFVRIFDFDQAQPYGPTNLVPRLADNPTITRNTCVRYNACKTPPNRYADAMRVAYSLHAYRVISDRTDAVLVRPEFKQAHSWLGRLCKSPNPDDREHQVCGPFKPARVDDVLLPHAGILALSKPDQLFGKYRIEMSKVNGSTPVFVSSKARRNATLMAKLRKAGANV